MKYYLKIICGFDDDQQYSIPAQEGHKAYFLFRNPEKRGVFDNGLAIIGKDIRRIIPDWNMTMGYNPTHELNDDDWNQIRGMGVEQKMRAIVQKAEDVALLIPKRPDLASMRLGEIIESNDGLITFPQTESIAESFKITD